MKIHLLNENTYLDMANALAEGPFGEQLSCREPRFLPA